MTVRVRTEVAPVVGAPQRLGEDSAHHLLRVLRLTLGAEIALVGPDGALWRAEVTSLSPVAVTPLARLEGATADPTCALEVWLPLLKGGRTDGLVRQLTELGVTRVVPFVSERAVARPDARRAAKQVERWRAIALEATRQCRRGDVVAVTDVHGLPDAGPGVFFWEEPGPTAREVLASAPAARVLVGPEGGLTAAEARRLSALGWRSAWLGPRVLRAETAVVAAVTLALSALGEGGY